MSKYKLAVSDTVVVPVEGSLNDDSGKPVPFKFSLICKRLSTTEQNQMFATKTAQQVMSSQAIGWSGQQLVLNDDGSPAEFCLEALDALFDIQGMAPVCLSAFIKEASAREKN